MRRIIFLGILFTSLILTVGCAQTTLSDKEVANKSNSSKSDDDKPINLTPKMGEISVIIPKGWTTVEQHQPKDTEVISYIRKIDKSLWANSGLAGTNNLPVMSMTISLRDAKASRSDLEPQSFSKSLLNQHVFLKLEKAQEIKVANLTATIVVGDSPDRERTTIVMLPYNGYLYKWTLDGDSARNPQPSIDFDAMLASAKLNK